MRDVKDVDRSPNSYPQIESVEDPEDARLPGKDDVKVCELKVNPSDKDPNCNPTVSTEFNRRNPKPIIDLQLSLESEFHSELSQLDRPKRMVTLLLRVPKFEPNIIEIREPVDGKFFTFWAAPRRVTLAKIGAS